MIPSLVRWSFFTLVALAPSADATLVTFGTAQEYADNFVKTFDSAPGPNLTYNSTAQNIRLSPTGLLGFQTSTSVLRYSPGGVIGTIFMTEPIGLDFHPEGGSGPPYAGVLTRIQASGLGIYAFFAQTSNEYTFGLAYGVDTTSAGAGTVFWQADVNPFTGVISPRAGFSGGSAVGNTFGTSPSHLLLTQTGDANPVFNLTLSDANGFAASSGNVTLSATTGYSQAGGVGIRMSSSVAPITADNFSVGPIPEPATWCSVLLGSSFLLTGRFRRRVRKGAS